MKILIVIYGTTDGIEMLRAAQALRSHGFELSVHIMGHGDMILERIGLEQIEGLSLSDARGPVSYAAFASKRAGNPVWRRAVRFPLRVWRYAFYRVGLGFGATLPGEVARLWQDRVGCRRLLEREKPDLLIVPLESAGHHSATMAATAYDAGIPSMIIPYTVPVNVPELAERFFYDRSYWLDRPFARLVGRLWPNWVKVYRGRALLRLKPRQIVARWLLGLVPDRPWDAGGMQYTGAIAVENEAMLAFYRRERFPEEKLQHTGAIVDDLLANALACREAAKARLYERLSLDPHKPLLLCAFPPDFTSREECDFKNFGELVHFWKAVLLSIGRFNVIMRPHPSLLPRDLATLQSGNIRIVLDDTANLLPLCDLYLASVSSTIRWAIACGIPVINYDVYRFRYQDFDMVPGVLRMEDREAFVAAVKRFDDQPGELESLQAVQKSASRQWGDLDGRSVERIAALIEHLVCNCKPGFAATEIQCAAK